MLLALGALLAFQLAGELVVHAVKLPVPGPVVGLVLLYAALLVRGHVPDGLRATAGRLLEYLMLFLVPATTGLMLHLDRLRAEWLPIVVAVVGGTAITMAATAVSLRLLARIQRTR